MVIGLPLILLLVTGHATGAAAETVSLTVSPLSSISTTVVVTSALGNDSDGPKLAAVTGTAEASFATTVDPTFGRVATSLQISLSELAIADTSFDLFVVIPIAISIEGAEARFSRERDQRRAHHRRHDRARRDDPDRGTGPFDAAPAAGDAHPRSARRRLEDRVDPHPGSGWKSMKKSRYYNDALANREKARAILQR